MWINLFKQVNPIIAYKQCKFFMQWLLLCHCRFESTIQSNWSKLWKTFKFKISLWIHWPSKCLVRVACLWSKIPMIQRAGMREGGLPLLPAFQYLILMTWRSCDLNFVMISKCQDFKLSFIIKSFSSNSIDLITYLLLVAFTTCNKMHLTF